jgi:hypothetical protein
MEDKNMCARFINDDVRLMVENGGIKTVPITPERLWEEIIARISYLLEDDTEWLNEIMESYKDDEYDYHKQTIVKVLFHQDKALQKDLGIQVDFENLEVEEDLMDGIQGESLVGFHTLNNNFTFLGIEAGGDWECPVFIILYYDGNRIKAYVPSYGNCFNLDFKSALGSEINVREYDNIDTDIIEEKCEKEYTELGIDFGKDNMGYIDWAEAYCKKYDLTCEDIGYNWDAIKEDILFQLKN